jgi:hypothetical protein
MHLGSPAASGKKRWLCRAGSGAREYCYSTTNPQSLVARKQDGSTQKRRKVAIFKRTLGKGKTTFLVTAAQNATPIHKNFLKALEIYANKHSAEIVVIPLRYKNPTSRWTESQANDETWAPEVTPYLWNVRRKLNQNIIVLGDIKTQPTATDPLTGFDAITHAESGILGHTKLALRTVPVPHGSYAKILTTTGACTVPNYSDTKAGKLGEFHHTLGACLVELEGRKTFHLRQLNASRDTGMFTDIDTLYGCDWNSNGMDSGRRASALVLGDWHTDYALPSVQRATDDMIRVLKPEQIVWHDLDDNYSCNPHHAGNPFNLIAKVQNGRIDVRAEAERACEYVVSHTPKGCRSVIVPSNHNDFLTRWIVNSDWKHQPGNAEFYLETALHMVRNTKLCLTGTTYPDAFAYWARKFIGNRADVLVLERGQSHVIEGIECGLHFDKGPNGARGSLRNLCRVGVKVLGGHGHGPGIREGGMQVGTATGPLEYGIGSPSGWANTHAVIYRGGKRSLLNIIGETWRASR